MGDRPVEYQHNGVYCIDETPSTFAESFLQQKFLGTKLYRFENTCIIDLGMDNYPLFAYGSWIHPVSQQKLDVIVPITEKLIFE